MTATQGVAELLPCPFCGVADASAKMYGRDMLFKVECSGCGAEMRGFDQCQQDAIDAWNTRPSPDSKLEAYRRALEAVEFRGHQGKCPLCAGWMMSAYGETPGKHTADCLVGKARAAGG